MSRLAVVVGIDDYKHAPLSGCVNDAVSISSVLSNNDDGSINFQTRTITSENTYISRAILRSALKDLFHSATDFALFYFSGHGLLNELGGYLVTQDASSFDEGVSMSDVLAIASQSSSREVVIILDCCHSGAFGRSHGINKETVILNQGMSVLCASQANETAIERDGHGVFTSLVSEALLGGAADLLGEVTAADVYAFVNRTSGPWGQRALFKCSISGMMPIRRCNPQINLTVMRRLTEYFPTKNFELPLNPTYEYYRPDLDTPTLQDEMHVDLRTYRSVGLIRPSSSDSMYSEAMKCGSCRLTSQGKYYWKLVYQHLI